jgi:hypothetical protein
MTQDLMINPSRSELHTAHIYSAVKVTVEVKFIPKKSFFCRDESAWGNASARLRGVKSPVVVTFDL